MSGKVLVLLGIMMSIAGAVSTLPQTDWHGGPGTPGPVGIGVLVFSPPIALITYTNTDVSHLP